MSLPVSLDRQPARLASVRNVSVASLILLFAVFLAPFRLASIWPNGGYRDVGQLRESVGDGFVAYWSTGSAALNPELASAVDFWARFHVVKALFAAALLVVLVPMGIAIWQRYIRTPSLGRRLALGMLGLANAALAFLALLILTANIQGAIAPWTSIMGMLPSAASDPAVAAAQREVSASLANGAQSPAVDALINDFVIYHAVMVGVGLVTCAGLVVAMVLVWRARRRTPRVQRRQRRVLGVGLFGLLTVLGFFALVTAANLSTVLKPVPALIGAFNGGS